MLAREISAATGCHCLLAHVTFCGWSVTKIMNGLNPCSRMQARDMEMPTSSAAQPVRVESCRQVSGHLKKLLLYSDRAPNHLISCSTWSSVAELAQGC